MAGAGREPVGQVPQWAVELEQKARCVVWLGPDGEGEAEGERGAVFPQGKGGSAFVFATHSSTLTPTPHAFACNWVSVVVEFLMMLGPDVLGLCDSPFQGACSHQSLPLGIAQFLAG